MPDQSRPAWPWRRLAVQLAPAVLVSAVGVVLLSQIASPRPTTPAQAPADTAITAEAVFTATPREPVAAAVAETAPSAARTQQAARAAARPKPVAPAAVPLPPRLAMIGEPLPPAPSTEDTPAPAAAVQASAAQAPARNFLAERLRSAKSALDRIPQWARSLTDWTTVDPLPPRPPAAIPSQDFARIDLPPNSLQ